MINPDYFDRETEHVSIRIVRITKLNFLDVFQLYYGTDLLLTHSNASAVWRTASIFAEFHKVKVRMSPETLRAMEHGFRQEAMWWELSDPTKSVGGRANDGDLRWIGTAQGLDKQ